MAQKLSASLRPMPNRAPPQAVDVCPHAGERRRVRKWLQRLKSAPAPCTHATKPTKPTKPTQGDEKGGGRRFCSVSDAGISYDLSRPLPHHAGSVGRHMFTTPMPWHCQDPSGQNADACTGSTAGSNRLAIVCRRREILFETGALRWRAPSLVTAGGGQKSESALGRKPPASSFGQKTAR